VRKPVFSNAGAYNRVARCIRWFANLASESSRQWLARLAIPHRYSSPVPIWPAGRSARALFDRGFSDLTHAIGFHSRGR